MYWFTIYWFRTIVVSFCYMFFANIVKNRKKRIAAKNNLIEKYEKIRDAREDFEKRNGKNYVACTHPYYQLLLHAEAALLVEVMRLFPEERRHNTPRLKYLKSRMINWTEH
jgi:hypothetical protein